MKQNRPPKNGPARHDGCGRRCHGRAFPRDLPPWPAICSFAVCLVFCLCAGAAQSGRHDSSSRESDQASLIASSAAPFSRFEEGGVFRESDSPASGVLGNAGDAHGRLQPARRLWDRLRATPLARRVISVARWVACLMRFLWTIPKALLQGDSQAMIEALGELLARSTPGGGREAPGPGDSDSGEDGGEGPASSEENLPAGAS